MNDYQSKIIKPKLGLLELAKQLGSVTRWATHAIAFIALRSCMELYDTGGGSLDGHDA